MELVTNEGGTSLARLGIDDRVVKNPKGAENNIQTFKVSKPFTREEIENLHKKRSELDEERSKLNANLKLLELTSFKNSTKKYFGENELKKKTINKLKEITTSHALLEPVQGDKLKQEAKNTNLLTGLSMLIGGGIGYLFLVSEQDGATASKHGALKSDAMTLARKAKGVEDDIEPLVSKALKKENNLNDFENTVHQIKTELGEKASSEDISQVLVAKFIADHASNTHTIDSVKNEKGESTENIDEMNKQIYKNYLTYSNIKLMNPIKAFRNFAAQFFGGKEKMDKTLEANLKEAKTLLIESSKTILPSMIESVLTDKPVDQKIINKFDKKNKKFMAKVVKDHQEPINKMTQVFKASAKGLPGGNQMLKDLALQDS